MIVRILLWRTLALAATALGMVGVVVPGLPTVPLLILAAWAASRGWPRFERWLLDHPRWGTAIRRWRSNRQVPRAAKWSAAAMMALSAAVLVATGLPLAAKGLVILTMAAVLAWLWCQAEPPPA